MQTDHLLFTFVTPEKELLNKKEVQEILCPSENGQLNILPQHSPLVTLLKPGVLAYKVEGQWEQSVVSWGYMEVYPEGVRVLAETAETGQEISKIKVEKRITELKEKLEDPLLSQKEIRNLQQDLEKEQARLSFSKKQKN